MLAKVGPVTAVAHDSVHPSAHVAATAIVERPCVVGEGTAIHHFAHVAMGARIGARCVLGQGVSVAPRAILGDGVRVQNHVSIFDGVTLEDDVFVGPSAVFTNVPNPRAAISRRAWFEPTRVRRGATIGANATIACGITIGRHAFVGAGAVVTRDVPDYALVVGVPARMRAFMSRHGQRLRAPAPGEHEICPESGLRYARVGDDLRCLDLDEDAPLPGVDRGERLEAQLPFLRARRDT